MGKKYKGWELMKAIAEGEIKDGDRVKTSCLDDLYIFDGRSFRNSAREYISDYLQDKEYALGEFELLQDEIDIEDIKEIYINSNKVGENSDKCWTGRNLDLVIVQKINELVQAIKQINQDKED